MKHIQGGLSEAKAVITPALKSISTKGPFSSTAARGHDAETETGSRTFRVEPAHRATPHTERRSSETTANAAALRLGVAAQMLASRTAHDSDVLVLPSHPAMRMAARYASTAEGVAPTSTLGFSRTI
ncbi:MAG: hypothetical protein AB8B88_06370 [Devosiaceae bacterium]